MVVRVSLDALDLPGVVVTDRNAASLPRWMAPDAGLALLDHADIFGQYGNGKDHAQRMCAEILVPDRVPPEFITDVFVCTDTARAAALPVRSPTPVHVERRHFFQ